MSEVTKGSEDEVNLRDYVPNVKFELIPIKNLVSNQQYKPHIRPLKCISDLLFRRTIRHLLAGILSPQRFVSRIIRQN